MVTSLIIGTRGSRLALVQAHSVARDLEAGRDDLSVQVRVLKTKGDADRSASLDTFGGEGVFVKELERALVSGEIDMAVHSLKDLPTSLPDGLAIAAVPERVDVRDALVSRDGAGLDELPTGALVATGSPRRRSQLQYYRPDLRFSGIRGNIDTRLQKLEGPDGPDAIMLAAAGLQRLGWIDRVSEILTPEVCMPAVGQAALAIEIRKDDRPALEAARRIEDLAVRQAVMAERSFLNHIGGGCHTPVGAWGRMQGDFLEVDAVLAADDGSWIARHGLRGRPEEGPELGRRLAEAVMAQAELAEQSGGTRPSRPTKPTRPGTESP